MAGVKISNLPAIAVPAASDIFPVVQAGVTYKETITQLGTLLVPITGGTMTGDLILNTSAPTTGLQAASKDYVDNAISSVTIQRACRLATTGALTATYSNGASGVGATLTNAGAMAALSIDSVSTVIGDRILVKNQASTFQNGIYSVTTVGSGAVNWVMTRTTDFDTTSEIEAGDFFTVAFGTTNGLTQWIQTEVVATIGTDAILFQSNVVAGTGITKTNNTVALTTPVTMATGGSSKALVASNGGLVYTDADSMEILAGTATAGQIPRSGASSAPSWSTATFASTYAASNILYSNGANIVQGLTTANSSILGTSSTGVPTWLGSATNGQIPIGSTGATPVLATITGSSGITITNGAGTINISGGGSGYTWTEVTGTSQSMAVDSGYIANNAALVTLTLPAVAAVGDTVSTVGKGAGLFAIAQNAGQQIHLGSSATTVGVGGSLTATNQWDSIELICVTANDVWVTLTGPQGNFTVV